MDFLRRSVPKKPRLNMSGRLAGELGVKKKSNSTTVNKKGMIMTYEEKCDFAIKELDAAKIWKSNYNPPIVKFARKLGFKVRFPHYNSFLTNWLSTGLYFGLFWGIYMYFFSWNTKNMSIAAMLSTALFAGALFGLAMATYYSCSFKKHKLTPWHEMKNT